MSNSSTSRYERENRRYQRSANNDLGFECRHLNSAGHGLLMEYMLQQTRSLSFLQHNGISASCHALFGLAVRPRKVQFALAPPESDHRALKFTHVSRAE